MSETDYDPTWEALDQAYDKLEEVRAGHLGEEQFQEYVEARDMIQKLKDYIDDKAASHLED